jgi:KDO2-lipid IV(A) lauroyltransferase
LFGHINKLKRGYYVVEFSLLTDNPVATEHGYITEQLMRLIEEDVLKQPEYWLWSHRRWKHKQPE